MMLELVAVDITPDLRYISQNFNTPCFIKQLMDPLITQKTKLKSLNADVIVGYVPRESFLPPNSTNLV